MTFKYALILSAGRGKRLRPLTDTVPKPLIKAGKYRLIEYHIKNLLKLGINNVLINRAHLADQFDLLLENPDLNTANIQFLDEPIGALETAGAINNAFKHISSDKLLVINGDIWCDFPYSQLTDFPNREDKAHIILVANPPHHPNGDFSLNNNRPGLVKPGLTSYTFSGIGVYHRSIFADLEIKKQKLAPILHQLIKTRQISASLHNGQWMDIGTPQRLQELRQTLIYKDC